jgi:RHS repeat-associated protein
LAQAWTSAVTADTACADAPTSGTASAVVGGFAPYWNSYGFDVMGNRASVTAHSLTGGVDSVATGAYPVPGAGVVRPHAVTSMQVTAGTGTGVDAPAVGGTTFGYDAVGNLTSRVVGSGAGQVLTWDGEGHLSGVAQGGQDTSYVYDGDGGRLVRREPGRVTLSVGDTEVHLDTATGVKTATRYYSWGGRTIATRDFLEVRFTATDPHNSGEVDVDSASMVITRRPLDPFGVPLGTGARWLGEKGFTNGTKDPSTGLTHLGAREYDPVGGRFISVDPVIDPGDPQQLNGYAYANNAPTTSSDPTGLRSETIGGTYVGGGHTGTSPSHVVRLGHHGARYSPPTYTRHYPAPVSYARRSSVPHGAAPPEQPSLYVQNWHDKVRLDEARQQATADYMDHLAEQSRGDGPAMAHAAATGAHYLLGACGFVPGAGDLACDSLDAGIYAAQGDATGTALSAASMIPFLGWATGAGKLTKLGAKSARRAGKAANNSLKAPQVLRVGDVNLSAVPKGAGGARTQTGKGMEYVIPRGTSEISERVTSVRIMDPVTSGKYQYPNGYAVYMNSSGQTINPLTGQTIANSHPFAHIPLP